MLRPIGAHGCMTFGIYAHRIDFFVPVRRWRIVDEALAGLLEVSLIFGVVLTKHRAFASITVISLILMSETVPRLGSSRNWNTLSRAGLIIHNEGLCLLVEIRRNLLFAILVNTIGHNILSIKLINFRR